MKSRAVLVALALAGLSYLLAAQAQEPDRPKSGDSSAKIKEDLTVREQILQRQFDDFMQAMLKLKQRLERSDKADDKEKAKILERAIAQAQDASISTKFDQLVSFLKKEQFSKVDDIQKAKDQAVDLARNLKILLDTLREDTRANRLREEREQLEKIIKALEKVIHEQKVMQTRTELPNSDPKGLHRDQNKVTQATRNIAEQIAKITQGGEAKDTKGEAKAGKGADKSGQGKDAGKGTESKKAESKEAGKGDSAKSEAKGSEGKQSQAKSGDGKDGGAKGSKAGSDSKAGGSKGNQGQEGKDGQAKNDGNPNKEPGIREKRAEAKGDQGKEAANTGKQSESKPGGQKGSEAKAGGSKGSQSGSESKSGDSKSGGSESKQGEAKSGQSSSGQSSSKASGKEAGGSKGDPNQKQQDEPPGRDLGKKQVEEGNYHQQQSEGNLEKKQTKPASDDMEKAIQKLEEARRKLEKLLQQTREEELERLLAALQARCEKMLALQIIVLNGTQALDKSIQKNSDKQPLHADKQRGVRLSDDEKEIVLEADKAIQMLEAEGSAVAFPEVFQQVREDMRHVQRRLYVTDAGVVTQAIEQDIIDTLKEMIEALKKARNELDQKKNPPKGGQPPPNADQKLLDLIAELKMIRAMQMRVNTRTKTYGAQYPGEQAGEPRIRQELRNLSDRQVRIFDVTNKIAKGDNR